MQQRMQQLIEQFILILHVPFREKDSVYDTYHAALYKIHLLLNANSQRRRMDAFKQNIKAAAKRGGQAVDNERTRVQRRLDQMRQDLKTYENNICFLSVSSKKGNSLIDEMKRRVERLKADIALAEEQLKEIAQ